MVNRKLQHFTTKFIFFVILATSVISCGKMHENKLLDIYVGTKSGNPEAGIYQLTFSPDSGSFEFKNKTRILNPGFLHISPDRRNLYCINNIENSETDGVTAYKIDPETGALTFLNQQSSGGPGACYVSTDKTGKFVLAANYSGGSVIVLPVLSDGRLGEATDFVQHEGSSVHPRQTSPHAHYFHVDPQNRFVFSADLGADKIFIYELNHETGELKPAPKPWFKLHAGTGPRHMDFHPNGEFAYVINELDGTITAFNCIPNVGELTAIQTISTLPDSFLGYNKSADIHIHPSGRFLYGSNRGDFDSIVIFEIDQKTGELSLMDFQTEHIVWPRNFAISPDGKFLLVANRNANNIVSFRIDQESGRLKPTGYSFDVPEPTCIKFY